MSTPDLYVATLGAAGSGQSTLADALVLRQDRRCPTDPRDEERHGVRGVSYRSERRRYRHVDCAGHTQHMRYLLAQEPIPDGVIAVAAADVGVTAELRDQLMVASKVGVPRVVAFLSKTDVATDAARLDAVERDVRQALAGADYPADDVPVVRGDLLAAKASRGEDDQACACVDVLVEAMEAAIPTPELPWRQRLRREPFLMDVDMCSREGDRASFVGRVARGELRPGDQVEAVGPLGPPCRAVVNSIHQGWIAACEIDVATNGEEIIVGVTDLSTDVLNEAYVLAAPGSVSVRRRFEAVVYLRTVAEGGGTDDVVSGQWLRLYIRGPGATARTTLPTGRERCRPGEWAVLTAELPADWPLAVVPKQSITVESTQGFGRVTRVLD